MASKARDARRNWRSVEVGFTTTATRVTLRGSADKRGRAISGERKRLEDGQKLNPRASVPARTATSISLEVFNPQILIRGWLWENRVIGDYGEVIQIEFGKGKK